MLAFCGGWKGWTSEQALAEDLNYIMAARTGHVEMLHAIFGKPKDKEAEPAAEAPPPNTPELPPFVHSQPDAPPITAGEFDDLFGKPQGNS